MELSYKPNIAIDIVPIAVKNDRDIMAFIYWQKKDNIPLCMILVRKSGNLACKEVFVSRHNDIVNLREDNDDMYYEGEDDTNDDDGGGDDKEGEGEEKKEEDDGDDEDEEEKEEGVNNNNNKIDDDVTVII
ncbi:hypothetical protein PanWU01x14_243840 [Parasponia andersonii]|uniref:Uncharacterized protein n=1 Tax=Parasponia andersonii TaxID=3476 RepID=A0A2P5BFH7_PARAD|nr:hypothetical protein PanWU01x14_243840 [Parasponia andersonii]